MAHMLLFKVLRLHLQQFFVWFTATTTAASVFASQVAAGTGAVGAS